MKPSAFRRPLLALYVAALRGIVATGDRWIGLSAFTGAGLPGAPIRDV